MKEQDKTPEEQLSEVEKGNLPEKEFTVMRAKMIQDLGERMAAQAEKLQEMFNKEDDRNLKNKQTIPEMKNTLEEINSRNQTEERIRELEDRLVEITVMELCKEKKNEKK